jgi:hypothetical protein
VHGIRFWHRGTELIAARLLHCNGSTSTIQDKVIYNLASNSYVLSGGDDYTMFTERPFLFPSGDTMDALMTSDLAAAMPKPVSG